MNIIDQLGILLSATDKYMRRQSFDPVPDRFERFLEIVRFFDKLASEQDGVLDPDSILPHNLHGHVTIRFEKLVLRGETYEKFIEVVQFSSALEFVSRTDGSFEISMTFPNIFKLKK